MEWLHFQILGSQLGDSFKGVFHCHTHCKTLKSLEVQCFYLRAGVKKDLRRCFSGREG